MNHELPTERYEIDRDGELTYVTSNQGMAQVVLDYARKHDLPDGTEVYAREIRPSPPAHLYIVGGPVGVEWIGPPERQKRLSPS